MGSNPTNSDQQHINLNAVKAELTNPPEVLAATEGDFPPFSNMTTGGSVEGIEIRVFGEVCRRLSLEYRPKKVKWADILEGLHTGAGGFDCSTASMDITPERKGLFFMSRPYTSASCVLVTLASDPLSIPAPEHQGAATLQGRTVITIENSTFASRLRELGATVLTTSAVGDAWPIALRNGTAHAFATEARHACALIAEFPDLCACQQPLQRLQKGFAVPRQRPHLAAAIDTILAAMERDGSLDALVAACD
jgi:ABC-type amino acid transport substrate-binding protein